MHFIILIDMSNIFNNIRICHVLIGLLPGECQNFPEGNGKGPNIRFRTEFCLQLNSFINKNQKKHSKYRKKCVCLRLCFVCLTYRLRILRLLRHKAIHVHISFKATFALFNIAYTISRIAFSISQPLPSALCLLPFALRQCCRSFGPEAIPKL